MDWLKASKLTIGNDSTFTVERTPIFRKFSKDAETNKDFKQGHYPVNQKERRKPLHQQDEVGKNEKNNNIRTLGKVETCRCRLFCLFRSRNGKN